MTSAMAPVEPALTSAPSAGRWIISGVVQGVGFRPFVYRLARQYGLQGWVKNCLGRVELVAAGSSGQLAAFGRDLLQRAPAIARPRIERFEALDACAVTGFRILDSDATDDSDIHLPVDYFVCEDCLAELNNPADRRYRYPFINCTQCGPRYTLIHALPYDRSNTSMAAFDLCEDCLNEYRNPLDRRFHAEPVACPACGPQLQFRHAECTVEDTADALSACVRALRQGLIVAVKGVGGYHLVCDAANRDAVQRIRDRKPRPHKPLAVLFPESENLKDLRSCAVMDSSEEQLLRSPARPVVLVKKSATLTLADNIAPGLDEIGVMLPYSPLHHLLLGDFGGPLVATSANRSGEPVLSEQREVEASLRHVAEAFLHHNRPIVRPADDPVYRTVAGKVRPLRMGRGDAPVELRLPLPLPRPVLAVGGHMKNTVCLAWGNRAVVSPHIGDMDATRSVQVFEQVIADLQKVYRVKAEVILCDLHPQYATTRWAHRQEFPVFEVQHHAAHASALTGECTASEILDNSLVFTWDGVGFGNDGTLWGGEALLGGPGNWRRVASMRRFSIPGAVNAGREPWRTAAALAWTIGADEVATQVFRKTFQNDRWPESRRLLHRAWRQSLNTSETSAVGRLFDAAAVLGGLCFEASFEGQGPMWLESCATTDAEPLPLPLEEFEGGVLRTDWQTLMERMADETVPRAQRASLFHASMAEALTQQALRLHDIHGFERVGLCGGVFQNRRLTGDCVQRLRAQGFRVSLAEQLPVNDAAISFGQVVEYACACSRGFEEK